MARHTDAVCRLCRREGMKLFLKGDRCLGSKCAIERQNYPPGQHGQTRKSKLSTYGKQLREKQKAKRTYGVLERQFRRYFQRATRLRGVTGTAIASAVRGRSGWRRIQAQSRDGSIALIASAISITHFETALARMRQLLSVLRETGFSDDHADVDAHMTMPLAPVAAMAQREDGADN